MICASPSELITMKCPSFYEEEVRAPCSNMEKDLSAAATAAKLTLKTKTSPLKEHIPAKPQFTPVDVTTELCSLNNSGPVNNKENKNSHNGEQFLLDEVLQDSGYLSLHNSRNDEHGSEEEHSTPTKLRQEKSSAPTWSPSKRSPYKLSPPKRSPYKHSPSKRSPYKLSTSKCKVAPSGTVFNSTPRMCLWKKQSPSSVASTTALSQSDQNLLPIVKFQQAVCEELEKGFQKNKRYDWSVVDKVAEDHLLDRVIGGHMGREYVDVFSSLLSRNMRVMLTNVLALLGDMDLISCRKVSRSWRKIINEDAAAHNRCQQARATLKESRNSSGQENWCILTRNDTLSRVVLSSMQSLASSTPSSTSATPNYRAGRRTPLSNNSRFNEYIQAAGGLKQHESLRSCIRCGSPAKHLVEAQRATCTRASCSFEFCTCCQETFHGSTPCRTVTPRIARHSSKMSTILPGSARSKRNVKRL